MRLDKASTKVLNLCGYKGYCFLILLRLQGHYNGHGYLKDGSGAELICVQVDFDLK